jgi:hypothetical protein
MIRARFHRVVPLLAFSPALAAVAVALGADARFTIHPQEPLTLIRDDSSVKDVPLSQVIASRKTLDRQSLNSGLRVEVVTYKAAAESCPLVDHDTDGGGCASLLISAWLDLAGHTQYALWHVTAPRAMWAVAPMQPGREGRATEYERILLACEPPAEIAATRQTLQLDDVLMYGVPYRLRVRAVFVPDRANSAGRPAPSHVEYEATLDRLTDEAIGGKKYSCTGEPMRV